MLRSSAVIDTDAIRANVAHLKAGTPAELMAVVKADGYGHGLVPSARAALAGGASWLGVAMLEEALALRAAAIEVPVLAWLWAPNETDLLARAVASGVDISVNSTAALGVVALAVADAGRSARVHLKIDTGLGRNGATQGDWPELVEAAARAQASGAIEIIGVWSHFAYADEPGHPTIALQIANFEEALQVAAGLGVRPQVRHLANSAATLTLPAAHFDLVRPGIAVYGLDPVEGSVAGRELVPAMTLRSTVALTKRVEAGQGVSYGHVYTTTKPTTLALVPLGYADGIPRRATNVGPLLVNGTRVTVSGRVCMDQVVVDMGDTPVHAGDEVVIFGPGTHGEPTAGDWAAATDTIHYEIVTRISSRVPREHIGEFAPEPPAPTGSSW